MILFPDQQVSESSESIQQVLSMIGHTGRYPILDCLLSADCAAPPFLLVCLSTCHVNISNILNLFLLCASISQSASCEQYAQYATECIWSVCFFPRPHLRVFSIISMLSCLILSLCIRTVFWSAIEAILPHQFNRIS